MFKIGDYVVYKRDVCIVKDIKEKYFANNDYYLLSPIDDDSLTISLPISKSEDAIRNVMSKKEVEDLINKVLDVEVIIPENDRLIEHNYKELINSGKHEDLISIIKTAYLRNKNREDNGKKIGEKDDAYLKKAERTLYNEFSIALNMSYEDTKKYVVDKVNKKSNM